MSPCVRVCPQTSVGNGVPLCSYHHHLVHDRGWVIDWNAQTGILRFIGPKGQLLEANAEFVPRLVA